MPYSDFQLISLILYIQGNYLTVYTDRNVVVSIRLKPGSSGNDRDYAPNYIGAKRASNGVHMMNYSFGKSSGRVSLRSGGYVILGYADKTPERFDVR